MVVEIRPARPEDTAFIVARFDELLRSAWAHYYFPRPTKGKRRVESARYMADQLRRFRGARGFFRVAEVDGRLAGFVSAEVKTDRTHYRAPTRTGIIQEIHVDPAHRRRGVGTALLTAAETELARRGCGKTWVWSMAFSTAAHAMYRKRGFRVVYYQFEKRRRPR